MTEINRRRESQLESIFKDGFATMVGSGIGLIVTGMLTETPFYTTLGTGLFTSGAVGYSLSKYLNRKSVD